ncbi:MAG: hypothetical protein WCK47_12710 [bacterium]|nr:hypothetical protein [Candidatus Sumerlaeota bacterium]
MKDKSRKHGTPPPQGDKENEHKSSYQDDPRYKQFYSRLRKTQSRPTYDEDIKPMTIEELDQQGWDGSIKTPESEFPWMPNLAVASSSAPSAPPPPTAQNSTPLAGPIKLAGPGSTTPTIITPSRQPLPAQPAAELTHGEIMCFDDGSVAVYKDAVSGKDYALFYFLEPDGRAEPRGIFFEQYDRQRIGKLPEKLFEKMCEENQWDYDAIIYHLDKYENTAYIRRLMGSRPAQTRKAAVIERSATAVADPAREPAETAPTAPAPRNSFERGQVIRINVGGRVWESIYWGRDETGPVVAHDTNREWALMHLDLDRFKDCVEYGELLPADRINEIVASLLHKES